MIHRVVRRHDRIWGPTIYAKLVAVQADQYIASEYRPGAGEISDSQQCILDIENPAYTVPNAKWCKVLTSRMMKLINGNSPDDNDDVLGTVNESAITSWFTSNAPGGLIYITSNENPATFVFDELDTKSQNFIEAFFRILKTSFSSYSNQFGCYLFPGTSISYDSISSGIDSILLANSFICPEMYFPQVSYCTIFNKVSHTKADEWLKEQMTEVVSDNPPKKRIKYILERRLALGSNSIIAPIIPATNQQLNGDNRGSRDRYMSRIAYILAKSGYAFSGSRGFGSFKWDYSAIGYDNALVDKYLFPNKPCSWTNVIGNISQTTVDNATEWAKTRADVFINAFIKYKLENSIVPIVGLPDCPNQGASGGKKPATRSPYPPYTRKRNKKTRPNSDPNKPDLIEPPSYGLGVKNNSYLARITAPLTANLNHPNRNAKTILEDAPDGTRNDINIRRWADNDSDRFDLWINEVTYGYGTKGIWATSKYYKRYYPQAFDQTPISVKGICRDELEYEELASFIREQQIAMSWRAENLFKLYIPPAGIDMLGTINTFRGGIQAKNKGIPVAPEFEFDFLVIYDLNKNQGKNVSLSSRKVAFFDSDQQWIRSFKSYRDDYIAASIMHDIEKESPATDTRNKNKKKVAGGNTPDVTDLINKALDEAKAIAKFLFG